MDVTPSRGLGALPQKSCIFKGKAWLGGCSGVFRSLSATRWQKTACPEPKSLKLRAPIPPEGGFQPPLFWPPAVIGQASGVLSGMAARSCVSAPAA